MGLNAEEPHVHWRVPVVEEVHRYDSVNRHPRKIRPPKFEPEGGLQLDVTDEGILKETEEIELPEINLPTTDDSAVEEVNIDQLANYPPLIPTEPNLISLESSSLKNVPNYSFSVRQLCPSSSDGGNGSTQSSNQRRGYIELSSVAPW